MRHDNSHHLLAAAQRRRADTLERARKALQELGATGQRRTVTQIAAHAGVSRSWLYAQPELRDQLRRLTAISETPEPAPARIERGSDASLRQRLTLAHERIRELDDETVNCGTRSHSCTDSSAPTASPPPTSRTPSTTQTPSSRP